MQTGEMLGFVGQAFEEVFGTEEVQDQGLLGEGFVGKVIGAVKGSL